jgi:hypothetical protein
LPQAPWSLFINLMGVLGIVWAIARLVVEDWRLIKIDAAGRIAVAIFIVYGLAVLNLPLLFGAFVISELGGSLIELVAIKQKPLASESPDQ